MKMYSSKDITNTLEHLGLLNVIEEAATHVDPRNKRPDGPRVTTAKCYSLECTGDIKCTRGGVIKHTKEDTCPDCGYYLVWSSNQT